MVSGLWGRKLGMTQLFEQDKVVPVTAIDLSSWRIIGRKTAQKDGYNALRVGLVRDRYAAEPFTRDWLQETKRYFQYIREVRYESNVTEIKAKIGDSVALDNIFAEGSLVDVVGTTRGKGFAGCVKRYGFSGGRSSHGSTMGERRPGSISWMRRQGRVIKGKRMAGHLGVTQRMMQKLRVVKFEPKQNVVFIKGSVPGHVSSLLYIRKK